LKPRIAIFGAGPAGLFAAETAASQGCAVTIYDKMRLPGRKFLLAGRGGLNLTHAEPLADFVTRYREGAAALAPLVEAFPPSALRDWTHGLGQDTFVGSSNRIYPRAFKSSPLLRAWLGHLEALGIRFVGGANLLSLTNGEPNVRIGDATHVIDAHAVVLALGGASWPELGSDGAWTTLFAEGEIAPLQQSNAGVLIAWPDAIRALAGKPLKQIGVIVAQQRFQGEAILTERGLEGGAIYLSNAAIRNELQARRNDICVDFQPNLSVDVVAERVVRRQAKRTLAPWLESALGLSPASARIVSVMSQADRSAAGLTRAVKRLALKLEGLAGINRAISTAGGVRWSALNPDLSLRRAANVFVAGEMLDWDAPTGGYLLQACFATGRAAGLGAVAYARARFSEA
jgi:uncharacterized flavoprotein (TIGR03862 family)